MTRVDETEPSGRRRELTTETVPAGTKGPLRFAAGRWSSPEPRPVVPAPRTPAEDLVVLAVAVGVLG